MYIILFILLILVLGVVWFINTPQFGATPTGERLERIKKSPNYRDGSFQNINPTSVMVEGVNYATMMKEFMFDRKQHINPPHKIPSVKTELNSLNPDTDILVWFGHSSYFMQTAGKKFLVDPVLSGSASPFSFGVKAFDGADDYKADDMPEIDYLIITHDHWDHLDYKTIMKLKNRVKKVVCSLGVGAHFEYWGFDTANIIELDWYQLANLDSGFTIQSAPARHFSGRSLKRNQSLWSAFMLRTPSQHIYIGGDGGYDTHFKEIGEKYGPFDLAILEQGQYNEKWRYIHILPSEVLQAAGELRAKRIFPVHNSKFALAYHPWSEPLEQISENIKSTSIKLVTPMIGEPVFMNDSLQVFSNWWESVK